MLIMHVMGPWNAPLCEALRKMPHPFQRTPQHKRTGRAHVRSIAAKCRTRNRRRRIAATPGRKQRNRMLQSVAVRTRRLHFWTAELLQAGARPAIMRPRLGCIGVIVAAAFRGDNKVGCKH
jgi:hypothetical protein